MTDNGNGDGGGGDGGGGGGGAPSDIPDSPADDSQVAAASADGGAGDAGVDIGSAAVDVQAPQFTRYLRVGNNTDQPVSLFLQYETASEDGTLQWVPGDPAQSTDAEPFELQAGEVTDLFDNGWRINASRVRIWAKAGDRDIVQFKTRDLWLVPETDPQGAHVYNDQQIETAYFVVY